MNDEELLKVFFNALRERLYEDMKKLYSGKMVELKHARWDRLQNEVECVCSNCHKYWIATEYMYDYVYCPRCGAKMDGERV